MMLWVSVPGPDRTRTGVGAVTREMIRVIKQLAWELGEAHFEPCFILHTRAVTSCVLPPVLSFPGLWEVSGLWPVSEGLGSCRQ